MGLGHLSPPRGDGGALVCRRQATERPSLCPHSKPDPSVRVHCLLGAAA
jgi:hypothetical protein